MFIADNQRIEVSEEYRDPLEQSSASNSGVVVRIALPPFQDALRIEYCMHTHAGDTIAVCFPARTSYYFGPEMCYVTRQNEMPHKGVHRTRQPSTGRFRVPIEDLENSIECVGKKQLTCKLPCNYFFPTHYIEFSKSSIA